MGIIDKVTTAYITCRLFINQVAVYYRDKNVGWLDYMKFIAA